MFAVLIVNNIENAKNVRYGFVLFKINVTKIHIAQANQKNIKPSISLPPIFSIMNKNMCFKTRQEMLTIYS